MIGLVKDCSFLPNKNQPLLIGVNLSEQKIVIAPINIATHRSHQRICPPETRGYSEMPTTMATHMKPKERLLVWFIGAWVILLHHKNEKPISMALPFPRSDSRTKKRALEAVLFDRMVGNQNVVLKRSVWVFVWQEVSACPDPLHNCYFAYCGSICCCWRLCLVSFCVCGILIK